MVFSLRCKDAEKVTIHRPGRELSIGNESAGTLIWNFTAFRTVRNKISPV